jgi:hypothetical protein
MKSQFTKTARHQNQGFIRIYSQANTMVSIKPSQIRNLLFDTIEVPWDKKEQETASIILSAAGDRTYSWKTSHPIRTSLDVLEQIINLAELGYCFDLTRYSGKEAEKLTKIEDLFEASNIVTRHKIPKGMK